MNVYQKLAQARCELQQTSLKKSGHNGYAGYDYMQLQDFIPAVNEIQNKLGLMSCFNIRLIAHPDGTNIEWATLLIINVEKPDEVIEFTTPTADAPVKGCTPVQCLGSKHTYIKRYLYQNAYEISENDIQDAVTGKEEPKNQVKKEEPKKEKPEPKETNEEFIPCTAEQYQFLMVSASKITPTWLEKKFGVDSLAKLSYSQAETLIKAITAKQNGNVAN